MATITKEKNLLFERAQKFQGPLSKIKVLIFDIDGILTDGKLFYMSEELGFNRNFHIQDGFAMKKMMELGFKVGVISGSKGSIIDLRFRDILKLDYIFLGNEDKRSAYEKILAEGFSDEDILYMGDEFIDLPLLQRVGFSATVPNSSPEIQSAVHYVTEREGGDGAAREVMDLLRMSRKMEFSIPQF